MTITAASVKALREKTGAGMMDCKKALNEVNGDMDAAIDFLRKKGQAKAGKKADRIAAEGLVALSISDDGKRAAMVEVNSETDFVAREGAFVEFVKTVADVALQNETADVDALNNASMGDTTVEETRKSLIAKIGENVQVRRVIFVSTDGVLGSYAHGGRIGVLVDLTGGDADVARDVAMHVAASNPEVISGDDVPQALIDKEKEIFKAQALDSGKPESIIEKMIGGRIKKFLGEMSLYGQPFVKDPSKTVEQLLKEKNATVAHFMRFEVGEGIEKEESNFAEEVMAQAKGA